MALSAGGGSPPKPQAFRVRLEPGHAAERGPGTHPEGGPSREGGTALGPAETRVAAQPMTRAPHPRLSAAVSHERGPGPPEKDQLCAPEDHGAHPAPGGGAQTADGEEAVLPLLQGEAAPVSGGPGPPHCCPARGRHRLWDGGLRAGGISAPGACSQKRAGSGAQQSPGGHSPRPLLTEELRGQRVLSLCLVTLRDSLEVTSRACGSRTSAPKQRSGHPSLRPAPSLSGRARGEGAVTAGGSALSGGGRSCGAAPAGGPSPRDSAAAALPGSAVPALEAPLLPAPSRRGHLASVRPPRADLERGLGDTVGRWQPAVGAGRPLVTPVLVGRGDLAPTWHMGESQGGGLGPHSPGVPVLREVRNKNGERRWPQSDDFCQR